MTTGAIIVAAGRSTRMGGGDKCATLLAGCSMLRYSVATFAAVVDRVVVVVAPGRVAAWEETARHERWPPITALVAGGKSRQASVHAGLATLVATEPVELVAIHDGARPLITQAVIRSTMQAALTTGAAIVAVPATDTIKRVADQRVVETPDRASLWAAQTPQAFRTAVLLESFAWAESRGIVPFTDEAGLVEAFGHPVAVVLGERSNIKVTEPADQIIAAALLAHRSGGGDA